MALKLSSALHVSSDMSQDILVYTTTDGGINLHSDNFEGHTILPNSLRKDVKFYPADSFVFTTTDFSGLSVYDRENSEEIYKYENEALYSHAYSPEYTIATYDDYNLKFYDLKCRYLINSRAHTGVHGRSKICWLNNYIYFNNASSLQVYDFRLLDTEVFKAKDVLDFAIAGEHCYFIKADGEGHFLYQAKLHSEGHSYVMKKVPYDRLDVLKGRDILVGILEKGIKLESQDHVSDVKLKDYKVSALHFGTKTGYLFADDQLYDLQVSYDDEGLP